MQQSLFRKLYDYDYELTITVDTLLARPSAAGDIR